MWYALAFLAGFLSGPLLGLALIGGNSILQEAHERAGGHRG